MKLAIDYAKHVASSTGELCQLSHSTFFGVAEAKLLRSASPKQWLHVLRVISSNIVSLLWLSNRPGLYWKWLISVKSATNPLDPWNRSCSCQVLVNIPLSSQANSGEANMLPTNWIHQMFFFASVLMGFAEQPGRFWYFQDIWRMSLLLGWHSVQYACCT